jgi:hypothetical protein|tara:strand:- start:802 stop:987 length:186 start_codon:yes stop_codon:yes gene_type:complete
MQLSRNTSMRSKRNIIMFLIKVILIFVTVSVAVTLLNKINFPSPNEDIEKIIPNEQIKIVK